MRTRPNSYSVKGVVSSSSQLASMAGADIIRSGGNLADAAVATSAVLCVTQNNLCGLGGDMFALIRMGDHEIIDLNASGRAFMRANIDYFDMDSISIEHREGNKALLLGFGDIAIPTVLVVSSSVYGIQRSLLFFILPLLGGIAGMTYLMFFMKRRPAPGLPAINSGVIAGFALALLLTAI